MEQQIDDYLVHFRDKRLSKPHRCQVCRRPALLYWHGHYVRRLITLTKIHAIPIRRLFCVLCQHTFALLPSFVVKFYHYAKKVISIALARLRTHTYHAVTEFIANGLSEQKDRGLAPLTLYFWRRKFA